MTPRHFVIHRTDGVDQQSLGPYAAADPEEAAALAECWAGSRSHLRWGSWDLIDAADHEVVARCSGFADEAVLLA